MKILPVLNSDSYKQFHHLMYPKGMTKLYSNMTPRSFKRLGCKYAVWFGIQYYIKEYLVKQWNELFFNKPLEDVLKEYNPTSGDWYKVEREIFKDPITDDGTKKSLKGLLYVGEKNGELFVEDQVSSAKEQEGLLTEVFVDGKIVRETSLSEIRNRLCQN